MEILTVSQLESFIDKFDIIEDQLMQYRLLSQEIKMNEKKLQTIKENLINLHFNKYESYMNSQGLVLATYKPYIQTQFKQKDFRTDHPDLFDLYSEEKVICKFLLK